MPRSTSSTPRRAVLTLASAALVAGTGAVAPAQAAERAAAPAPTARAQSAADWLARQLNDKALIRSGYDDGTGTFVRYTDYGLTLDVFFAFKDLGVKRGKRDAILDTFEKRVDAYVTSSGTTYAGSLAKLVTALERQHRDLSTYEDGDLFTRLVRTVHRGGDADGLAQAVGAPGTTNTFGQAYAVQALTLGRSDEADDAARFLLKQQCRQGYFRVYTKSADRTCDGGTAAQSGASVDATAVAVDALLTVQRRDVPGIRNRVVTRALAAAGRWLVGKQRANGGFKDMGVANANSTGLATAALDDLGRDRRALDGARWLKRHQVTKGLARDGALGGERGAVAYDNAAFAAGKQDGITRDNRYQWRRATAQAAAGLDALGR